jgi:hypothetical protein
MYNSEFITRTIEEVQKFNQKDIRTICTIDAKLIEQPSRSDAYVKANMEQYYVLANCWTLLAEDLAGVDVERLLEYHIRKFGLIETIKFCSTFANDLIAGEVRLKFSEAKPSASKPSYAYWLDAFGRAEFKDVLQVLRFAKRFTPHGGLKLTQAKLEAFLNVDRGELDKRYRYILDGKQVFRPYYHPELNTAGIPDAMPTLPPTRLHSHVIKALRVVIGDVLKGYKSPAPKFRKGTTIEQMRTWTGGSYTNGASQNVCTCTFCKELAMQTMLGNLPTLPTIAEHFRPANGTPSRSWNMEYGKPSYVLDGQGHPFYAVKAITVPKDYKGPRIIAPEKFEYQYKMKAVAAEFERLIKRNGYADAIPLHNQEVNQERARIGSYSGYYATLDLSHASDSVTKELVASLFPDDVVRDIITLMPSHVWVNGELHPLRMFGTMGSALTFIVESIVFYAIGQVAVIWSELFHQDDVSHPGAGIPVMASKGKPNKSANTAYGDDMVVPWYAAETAVDILETLGFVVNHDKSFYEEFKSDDWAYDVYGMTDHACFRESCGVEYYDGELLSSIYWPRRDMSQDTTFWDGFNEVYESRDSAWLHFANRLYTATNDRSNVCHSHTFMRLWLAKRFGAVFVPPHYAYEGMLIGDCLTTRVFDTLTRKRFETTWAEYDLHPEWRFLATTATRREFVPAKAKFYCPCHGLHGSPAAYMQAWDFIMYMKFLQQGPSYAGWLSKAVRCSTPKQSWRESTGSYKLTFRNSYIG